MTETDPTPTTQSYAPWFARVAAAVLDSLPVGILFWTLVALFGESQTTSTSFSFQLSGLPFLVYLVGALGWFGYNWLLLQGTRGQSLGKRALGIAIHRAGTSEPLGPGLTLARQLAHLVDAIPFGIGYLWPLWDRENRTFADIMVGSRAHRV